MTLPRSYLTEYADHRRASRVDVLPRSYRYMERLVPIDRHVISPAPESVLIGPGTSTWGVAWSDRLLVTDAAGTREYAGGAGRWLAAFEPDAVRLGNRLWRPGQTEPEELRPLGIFDEPCIQTVARWHDGIWTTVAQRRAPFAPNELMVRVRGNGPRLRDATAPRWGFDWPAEGTAAITDDGRVVVASIDRVLQVLQHPRDVNDRSPHVAARVELPHEPYAVSVVGDGFAVLSAIEVDPPHPSVRIGRLHGRGIHRFTPAWCTDVRYFDMDLRLRWCAELGFSALQPAVEGTAGRVIVVGRGVACVVDGAVTWGFASEHEAFASAFADGTLAVGLASSLVMFDQAGKATQTIAVPEGHTITTTPAIGPDGALALGTTAHTFVVPVTHA